MALLWQRDRERHLSVEILQLQNISLENPIVWHYLRDSTFSRFDTIPQCDRHTQRQTDRHTTTAYTTLSIASRSKNRPYWNYHCRQRATVDSKRYGYYYIFERQEAFEKCWAHSPLRAAARRIPIHQVSLPRYCGTPPAHRCPQQQRRRRQQRQRVTEGNRYFPIEWAQ